MYAGADRWYLVQEVHKDLWKGSNRKFSKIPWHKIEVQRHNAERTPEQQVSPTSMSIRSATMHGHFWENIKTCFWQWHQHHQIFSSLLAPLEYTACQDVTDVLSRKIGVMGSCIALCPVPEDGSMCSNNAWREH